MEMEFRGWDKLSAKMDALTVEISGKAMDKMVRAGAAVFKDAVIEAAPLLDKKTIGSSSLNPGDLKEGIRVSVRHNAVGTAEAKIGPGKNVVLVAYDVEYGHRQVHGGKLKLLGNGRTSGEGVAGEDVPAYPFIRPAYEAGIEPAETAMIASLNKTVKEMS